MNVLFLAKEGVDLYHTLLSSETSRHVLRFYHPKKLACGISVNVASLGSGLSLAGEMKWYRQRYMREMLFSLSPGIYATLALGREVYYEREATLEEEWGFRKMYGFRDGKLLSVMAMDPGVPIGEYKGQTFGMVDTLIEVWCMPDEMEGGPGEEPGDAAPETGEAPGQGNESPDPSRVG
jgi:hypothetical protein